MQYNKWLEELTRQRDIECEITSKTRAEISLRTSETSLLLILLTPSNRSPALKLRVQTLQKKIVTASTSIREASRSAWTTILTLGRCMAYGTLHNQISAINAIRELFG